MTTKQELIAQCLTDNPTMTAEINGVVIELSNAEKQKAAEKWAEMRLEQIAVENEIAAKLQAKASLLERLGITEEEAKLLLS